MSKGALIFAHNNNKFDYFRIASLNAKLIHKYLSIPVCVITDEKSVNDRKSNFDQIVLVDEFSESNERAFRDTSARLDIMNFKNMNRSNAYQLSPYDETLLIDADYLIQSNLLSQCWGSNYDLLINDEYTEIVSGRQYIHPRIDPFGIRMYWATAVYFNKSEQSHLFFSLVDEIRNNYQFYRERFNLPDRTYRNDFSFSIALHLMNAEQENNNFHGHLPGKKLHMAFDIDEIYSIQEQGRIVFNGDCQDGNHVLALNQDRDIHVMNKNSLIRHIDVLEELYQ